ncbi:MAG: hypothetical protein JW829_19870 [Pirellulales bacterium]|nr:hypothetical protein [Pirellulales bacterium]
MQPLRPAITLFELLLVLVLLCVVFAIAWPAIEGSFESTRLRSAADQVQAAWSEARLNAMQSGMPHLFRYQSDSQEYSVARWDWNLTADDPAAEQGFSAEDSGSAKNDSLPADIVFSSGEVASDQRTALVLTSAAEQGFVDAIAAAPIVFFPDGTTSDAAVLLKNKRGLLIRVTVRGLTGVTRISRVMTPQEMADEEDLP